MSERESHVPEGIDPDESPFELGEIAGLPFAKDSEEARAIEQIIREADAERAARADSG